MFLDFDNFSINCHTSAQIDISTISNWVYLDNEKVYVEFFQNIEITCHKLQITINYEVQCR